MTIQQINLNLYEPKKDLTFIIELKCIEYQLPHDILNLILQSAL